MQLTIPFTMLLSEKQRKSRKVGEYQALENFRESPTPFSYQTIPLQVVREKVKDGLSTEKFSSQLKAQSRHDLYARKHRMNSREHKDKENDIQDLIWKRIGISEDSRFHSDPEGQIWARKKISNFRLPHLGAWPLARKRKSVHFSCSVGKKRLMTAPTFGT
ncbi:hypothetical protein Nmel_009769 [Mimus melanotis]